MRLSIAAVAVLAASCVSAFRDTSPMLVWSSTPNEALADAASEITSGVIAADGVYSTLPTLGCDFDALVVVHVDELHQSHIDDASLPLGRRADLHIPYLVRPERDALDKAARSWALACGAGISWIDAAKGERALLPRSLPERHLIVYTGTRQERPFPSSSTSAGPAPSSTAAPGTNASEPLLDRVQLFTTPVITALLVSFGILLPILLCGISQLASIQVPPRMLEISKSMTTKEKKEQ